MPKLHQVFDDEFDCDEQEQDLDKAHENLSVVSKSGVEKKDSDDDDAEPEAVKFVDSKKSVLDHVRSAIRQIERDKQQLKATRHKRHIINKQHKKLDKLKSVSRLPDDILQVIPSEQLRISVNSQLQTNSQLQQIEIRGKHRHQNAQHNQHIRALNETGVAIKAVNVKRLQSSSRDKHFAVCRKRQQLYGQQVHRMKASELLSTKIKQKIMKSTS
jgi:anion-transporting  ArsA/GET3 family ATPase